MVQTREERLAKKRAYSREYYAANREARAAYRREYNAANREAIAARIREYNAYVVAPGFTRSRLGKMRVKYAVTLVMYYMLLDIQGWQCAVCFTPFSIESTGQKKGSAHIDHCHDGGGLRGLLCTSCNTGIGKLGDNVAGLMRAVNYLKKAEGE